MKNAFRKALVLFAALATTAFAQMGNAEVICPSDAVKPFVGTWEGQAMLIPVGGATQQFKNNDVFAVVDCQSFRITVTYLNSAGNVARIVDLKASPDQSGQPGLFTIHGTITENSV